MAKSGVSAPVRQFVVKHIESVAQLEVLLLLRAADDKEWTAQEVARALVIQPEPAAGWLEDLAGRGLASRGAGSYRYDPPRELGPTLDDLAESYAKYRVTLVALIFGKPSDGITNFSEAFRIRGER